MSGYTSDAGRFWFGTPGSPSIKNAWGTFLNDNAETIAALSVGYVQVNIAGLTSYSLTTANALPDQARPYMKSYTGALGAGCTVTLPNVQQLSLHQNATSGGQFVTLTCGGGTNVTLPDNGWYFVWTDGSGNTAIPPYGGIELLNNAFIAATQNGGVSITGTLGNDNAIAGRQGEFIPFTGNSVTLSSTVAADLATLSLTAGDWEAWGSIQYTTSAGLSFATGWLNTTTISPPAAPDPGYVSLAIGGGGLLETGTAFTVGRKRFSLATTTTIYLSTECGFGSGTASAVGAIEARRIR